MLYKTILADPPWFYNTWSAAGVTTKAKVGRGMADSYYPVMKTADICALPVNQFADKDSVLLMWATWPCLEAAFEVGKAWGFKYKTVGFVWVKTNRTRGNSFLTRDSGWHFGLGHWSRSNTEPCLLFTRGKPKRLNNDVSQLIISPLGRHSAKPPETHDLIERLVEGPFLELFSRNKREGWHHWGNEIESDIELAAKEGVA
jgi:N6-adenosine-specific RNA methylase IME4